MQSAHRIAPALVLAGLWSACSASHHSPIPLRLSLEPSALPADGISQALLRIHTSSLPALPPRVTLASNSHLLRIGDLQPARSGWQAVIRAGILPGKAELRVAVPGAAPAHLAIDLHGTWSDAAEDGTPDFLRLDDSADRAAFRRWFVFLAEQQFFTPPARRLPEINDCAALLRYAYREALRSHDSAWAAGSQLTLLPAFDSIRKYSFPYTPLGPALFRVRSGPLNARFPARSFAEFAAAQTLQRYNTHLVSHDLAHARPGDLLFFYHPQARMPWHAMIFIGPSLVERSNSSYIVYHTGPVHDAPGDMRRLSIYDLMNFPDPRWRPFPSNPAFLGVFRWNILRGSE